MSLPERLADILGPREEPPSPILGPADSTAGLMQKCVIIQRDERGYGFTVSGDNPVFVASVKQDGAAAKAGVQNGDRIVKVNGTLVTQRNHLDVVKLIKAGSYVALTLLGKPTPSASSGVISNPPSHAILRDSGIGRITAPQPIDPEKDRQLWQAKVHMTRAMYETIKEEFEKLQKQYVSKPSEKLHSQLLEKEKVVKALENQLKHLTGKEESDIIVTTTNAMTALHDTGNVSDSSQFSPRVSPTPEDSHSRHNGQETEFISQQEIIPPDYEDESSSEDQVESGPFADIKLLESKPAHLAVFINFLISNSDPSPMLFHIISDLYSRSPGSYKELRKWAYEIFSTFIYKSAPLSISVEDSVVSQLDSILASSNSRTDNESVLRSMFTTSKQLIQNEISDQLLDFRIKKSLGMGSLYGTQKLREDMDKSAEVKIAEELLLPHTKCSWAEDNSKGAVLERDLATAWAVATYLRSIGGTRSANSAVLERVQTFMMKDKKSIKFPGSRSSRAKAVKGHQLNLQHFYVTTSCTFCGNLIWGVGYQGYQCQNCEIVLHKLCTEEITANCGGKRSRISTKLPLPSVIPNRRPSSNIPGPVLPQQLQTTTSEQTSQPSTQGKSPPHTEAITQPYPKEEDSEMTGLNAGTHSVQNMVSRFQGLVSPTGSTTGTLGVPSQQEAGENRITDIPDLNRRDNINLNRTGSLNNKGKKGERPARRAKSDVDVDSDTFRDIHQSASSSASSLSNRSVESPATSTDNVNDLLRAQFDDPDMDLEPDLPPLKEVLPEEILKKLKPKEKKRQEVINELFYTERAHLRNLKVLDFLFNRPMHLEKGIMTELARALFPNMEEMIFLHVRFVNHIKERSQHAPVIEDVGDILLKQFDGEAGERFRKSCAEYCRNQAYALDALKKQTRKEPKLQQFLHDAESNALCRRLQLKDLVPSQMQRLTKYPLLIDNLLKYTHPGSDEYRRLERALDRCKHILAYVNQAVKECENFHRLKDIQKRLDRRSLEGLNDPAVQELKTLELTQHKLIFDSPLTWKLRSHRTVDLHAFLFEDLMVLLQKQDDKYVLKCQNTNVQSARDDKYTHFPVLKLQNLLARTLATEKRSFFVVNISESRAQMYEFTATSADLRMKWCKLINDKADEYKVKLSQADQALGEPNNLTKIGQNDGSGYDSQTSGSALEDIYEVTDQLSRRLDISDDSHMEEGDRGLIRPEEVNISDAVMSKSLTVNSPQEMLHHNWMQLETALSQREQFLAELLNQSEVSATQMTQQLDESRGREEDEQEHREQDADQIVAILLARALDMSRQMVALLSRPSSPSSTPSSLSPVVSCQQTQPPAQLQQQTFSMEQIKSMASEMNSILSKLAGAYNSGSDEKQRLRRELQKAQSRLDSLKQMKKQMTEAGTSPVETFNPGVPHSFDIPLMQDTSSTETDTDSLAPAETEATDDAQQEQNTLYPSSSIARMQQEMEAFKKYGVLKTTTGQSSSSSRVCSALFGVREDVVAHLDESVELLGAESNEVVSAVVTESKVGEIGDTGLLEGTDEDDDSNEVSVADLPLPDPVSIYHDDLVITQHQLHGFGDSQAEPLSFDLVHQRNSQNVTHQSAISVPQSSLSLESGAANHRKASTGGLETQGSSVDTGTI